ncbi:MAG: hypothetical protein U0237_09885 [Thermoleophilia bacterium]
MPSTAQTRPGDAPDPRRQRLGRVLGLLVTGLAIAAAIWFGATAGVREDRIVSRVAELQGLSPDRPATPGRAPIAGLRLQSLAALGWVPDGTRVDEVAGRAASTVFFTRAGRAIALTVVSGQPVPPERGAVRMERGGVEMFRQTRDGRLVLSWRRAGRTTVLSAVGVQQAELMDLVVELTPGRR